MSNLYESYAPASPYANQNVYGTQIINAQTFTPTVGHTIGSVILHLHRTGTPGVFTVSIRATDSGTGKPTGSDLCSGTSNGDTLTASEDGEEREITFATGYALSASTKYAICVQAPSGEVTTKMLIVHVKTSGTYTGGQQWYSSNNGSTWSDQGTFDTYFKEYGLPTSASSLSDGYTTKRLVVCGYGEVWLETAAGGTMAQVADSVGCLNTADFIDGFELYGKGFIVNKSIKKVLDLVNTKLTTADILPTNKVLPVHGTVVTGATSTASMIVDYIDATDSTCNIYGKRTTTATFTSGETVTGQIAVAGDVTFVLSAAEDAPPHFYNWTVYSGNATLYGAIPTNVTIGCNYRGRAVISGDSSHPHLWYMSRQSNPWNFLYGENDPLSAVAGNNTEAGEVGDIIRALIPYGDDFLIFGCSSSIWVLDGDPCSGGSIERIDESTGVYGPRSWCKDNGGNLYIYGSGGIYKMEGGRGRPANISYGILPKLVDDWAAAPASHRIILTYDPIRHGILISKTTLATGVNLNYWYDLKTQGFYPMTFPTACGIFSSYNYNSNAAATRKTIFGSNDGYLRYFLDTAKNDDSGSNDTAISSYAVLPIIKMNSEDDSEGKLISLTFELAGGASGGAFGDTDSLNYELHVGNEAETVLEDIKDGATAFSSGSFSTTGRQARIRTRVRGRWLGIKLYNSTVSKTWTINTLSGIIVPAGRLK